MKKIFLIIFVLQYIKADDDENVEKYIDLLPEEKKQEFLDRIARRISEAVSSPDIPNASHAEVNEEQLDAQSAYVNQIIKEESTNLQNDQETDNKKADKNDDDEPHIDLTLRTQSREERNGGELNEHLDVTSELKVIPVTNDQENLKSHNNSAIKSETNAEIKAIPDIDNSTELGKDMENELSTTKDSKNIENNNIIRKSSGDQLLFSTTISNYDPSSEENTLATEDEIVVSTSTINPDNANTTENDDKIIWISTIKIFDSESTESTNSESAETTSPSILNTLSNEEQETTSSSSILTLETENTKQEMTTSKTTENSSNFNQARGKNTKNTLKNIYVRSGDSDLRNISNITQLTYNNSTELKTNENNTDPVNVIVNDTISETNFTNSIDNKSNTSEGRSIYLVNKNKELTDNLKSKDSHISLRANYDSKEPQMDRLEEHNLKPDAKVYEVFEVAADKPPFVKKSNVEMKDTPYYIPVYNYAPNYAYFSPRNRFGPNTDNKDEDNKKSYEIYSNEDSSNIRSIFSGYNKREKTFYLNKPGRYTLKNHNDNIFDLTRPNKINHFQNIYYNPNDYLDMDYYFGRTYDNLLRNGDEEKDHVDEGFPNTDEEDHPYNSIHTSNSIKDHIRAVRNLLYLKQIYEPLPEEKKKQPRKFYNKRKNDNDTKYNERDVLRNNHEDNIAVDYYFGIEPNFKASQGVTIDKPIKNKLLRYPGKNKKIKTNAYYGKLNELKTANSIDNKLNTTLDKVMVSMLDVLRDFIRFDNQALSRYNWLESTVDILAAIKKLLELMKQLQFQEYIYPKDLELLKYILFLYKSSVNTLKTEMLDRNLDIIKELNRGGVEENETVKRNKGIMPKNKWNNRIRKPLKLWIDVASFIRRRMSEKEELRDGKKERVKLFYDFEDFLQNVMFSLRDFHDAIKHIAIITKYNNQKWYDDLKHIYLQNPSNKKLLTLLLHVSVLKLLNSFEKSATDGAENNFKEYIIYNKQYVQRSKEEFLFVLNILHELRGLNKQ